MTTLWVQRHRDVSLISQSEFLRFNDVVDVLVLSDGVFGASILACLGCLGEDLGGEAWVVGKQFGCVNPRNRVDRNVRGFVLEASMNINASVDGPDGSTEPLNGSEFVPFRRLSVINLKSYIFSNLVGSTSDDHHQGTEEQSRVLISWCGSFSSFVWSLDPVPSSITMTSETPSVTQTALISGPATKTHHHSRGTASLA